jgi:hypothetical protein
VSVLHRTFPARNRLLVEENGSIKLQVCWARHCEGYAQCCAWVKPRRRKPILVPLARPGKPACAVTFWTPCTNLQLYLSTLLSGLGTHNSELRSFIKLRVLSAALMQSAVFDASRAVQGCKRSTCDRIVISILHPGRSVTSRLERVPRPRIQYGEALLLCC